MTVDSSKPRHLARRAVLVAATAETASRCAGVMALSKWRTAHSIGPWRSSCTPRSLVTGGFGRGRSESQSQRGAPAGGRSVTQTVEVLSAYS
jgi:hypothetical protein